MKFVRTLCAAVLLFSASALTAEAANRYVVVFKSDVLPADAQAHVTAAGGSTVRALPEIGVLMAAGEARFVTKLSRDASVLAVGPENMLHLSPTTAVVALDADAATPDATTPDAATPDAGPTATDVYYFIYQWDMRRIGAPAVWSRMPLPIVGPRATVAVLDVGVMDNHPDLSGQLVATKATSYCQTSGGPNNTASYPKYSTLIDFDAHPVWEPSDGCTPVATTYEWHGTHVAGTIAAKFGGGRVVGVDPLGAVAAYKVFDRYRFTDPDKGLIDAVGAFDGPLFAAIIDATNNGYPVINMSLGGEVLRSDRSGNASWLAWDRVTRYANQHGTLIVASAGNEALDLNGPIASIPSDLPMVMSTSATGWSELVPGTTGYVPAPGSHDVLAFYSNVGASVDISAPGGDCGPTYPAGCEVQYLIMSDYIFPNGAAGYVFAAGTSMAAPHVAAVAAMVRALHPDWTPGDVRDYLKSTADPVDGRQEFGHGVVNADTAVR